MNPKARNEIEKVYKGSRVKIDGNESNIKMYVVLSKELMTYNGFRFKPGRWNEGPDKSGLSVWMNKPDYHLIPYVFDHTYSVEEVEQLLGEGITGTRYKRVKISAQPLSLNDLLGEDKKGFSGMYLYEANLTGADLSGANLSGTFLSKANLYGADLSGTIFYGADLSKANLYGANLSGAHLYRTDLSGANLTGADLSEANFSESNLTRADLSGAYLHKTDLSKTNLSKANLSGVDLSKANIYGSDLSNAHRSHIKYEGL